MTMPSRTFNIETGRWIGYGGNSGLSGFTLRVIDRPSHTVLADISLTPEQAFEMFSGGTLIATGGQGNDLEHVGKTMATKIVMVPRDVYKAAGRDKSETLRLSREWAQREHPDWEIYDAKLMNSGIDIVMHHWDGATDVVSKTLVTEAEIRADERERIARRLSHVPGSITRKRAVAIARTEVTDDA
jgi:hypothetical protein